MASALAYWLAGLKRKRCLEGLPFYSRRLFLCLFRSRIVFFLWSSSMGWLLNYSSKQFVRIFLMFIVQLYYWVQKLKGKGERKGKPKHYLSLRRYLITLEWLSSKKSRKCETSRFLQTTFRKLLTKKQDKPSIYLFTDFFNPSNFSNKTSFLIITATLIKKGQTSIMITFIRHAQSIFNEVVERFIKENNIGTDWVRLNKDQFYINEIKYAEKYLDCTITEHGKQECVEAKEELQKLKPDLILVSPLNRALATCDIIFKGETCPIIAEPLLAESLRSVCDHACEIQKKKETYPYINFQQVEKEGYFWFIDNDSENKERYYSIIDKSNGQSYPQTLHSIFEDLKGRTMYESSENVRRRTEKLKDLLRGYSKTYKNIAVVCHNNIIRFALATQFSDRSEPDYCTIKNCEAKPIQVHQL